ncbi:MAG: hypothetical protein DMD42_02650, partial [Gemmatimonadetes bacterium]
VFHREEEPAVGQAVEVVHLGDARVVNPRDTRDELDERAYRGLMTCHARLGERSQVQQLYQRVERLLEKQLEAKPEPETVQLYRRLLSP